MAVVNSWLGVVVLLYYKKERKKKEYMDGWEPECWYYITCQMTHMLSSSLPFLSIIHSFMCSSSSLPLPLNEKKKKNTFMKRPIPHLKDIFFTEEEERTFLPTRITWFNPSDPLNQTNFSLSLFLLIKTSFTVLSSSLIHTNPKRRRLKREIKFINGQ